LGFFRVSFRVYVGFLIGISLGGLWVSSRVSFRIQTGENKAKQKKNNETVKKGSREAKEHKAAKQQTRMTAEKESK
jgi:hypothetical protein